MSFLKSMTVVSALIFFSCSGSETISSNLSNINTNVSGLNGQLVIQINNEEAISIKENGSFDYKTQLEDGSNYKIKVIEEPCDQRCTVDHATGKVPENRQIKISVNCMAKSWTLPKSIDDHISLGSNAAHEDQIFSSINKYGDTILTWSQFNKNEQDVIYKKEFRDRQWIGPKDDDDFVGFNTAGATWPTNSINSMGDTFIVWDQLYVKDNYQIYLAQSLNDIWVFPSENSKPISDTRTTVVAYNSSIPPKVKSNDRGDVVIVWAQKDLSGYAQLYMAERRNTLWKYPANLDDHLNIRSENDQYLHLDIAMNENGNTVIAWSQSNGTTDQIYSAYYYNDEWNRPKDKNDNLSFVDSTNALFPSVSIDKNGYAIVAWLQRDSTVGVNQIYTAQLQKGQWHKPINKDDNLSSNSLEAGSPTVAMNDEGHAIITWSQDLISGGINQVFKSESNDSGESWSSPSRISVGNTNIFTPVVNIDNHDNILVVWEQESLSGTNIYHLVKAEYKPSTGWLFPTSELDQISIGSGNTRGYVINVKECRKVIMWSQQGSEGKYQNYYADYR